MLLSPGCDLIQKKMRLKEGVLELEFDSASPTVGLSVVPIAADNKRLNVRSTNGGLASGFGQGEVPW
jgi:hypothetical protein